MKERIDGLDTAKGFAIMLIAFSHCAYMDSYLKILAGGFNLPLFFAVSGMIYGITGRKIIIKNKIVKFIALYFLIDILLLVGTNRLFDKEAIMNLLTFKGNSPVWYLPCFLLVLVVFSTVEKFCANRDWTIMIYVLIAMLGLYFPCKQPEAIFRSFIGLIFFAVGYYLHKVFLKRRTWGLIILEFIMYIGFTWKNGRVDLWNMAVSNQLLYLFNAFIGLHICIQISYALESSMKFKRIKMLINTFGKHSLFILCTHWIFIGIAYIVETLIFGFSEFVNAPRIIREVHGIGRTIFVLVFNYLILICIIKFKKIRQSDKS